MRLKQYIEMRGVDSGDINHIMALSQFWFDAFYNPSHFEALVQMTSDWSFAEVNALYWLIAAQGKEALFRGHSITWWMETFFSPPHNVECLEANMCQ